MIITFNSEFKWIFFSPMVYRNFPKCERMLVSYMESYESVSLWAWVFSKKYETKVSVQRYSLDLQTFLTVQTTSVGKLTDKLIRVVCWVGLNEPLIAKYKLRSTQWATVACIRRMICGSNTITPSSSLVTFECNSNTTILEPVRHTHVNKRPACARNIIAPFMTKKEGDLPNQFIYNRL